MTQEKSEQNDNLVSSHHRDGVRVVMMSDQEVIDFIRESAVMAAVSNARDRINMMMASIALLATLIGGGVVFLANNWIAREVSASGVASLAALRSELSTAQQNQNKITDLLFAASEGRNEAKLNADLESFREKLRDEIEGTITLTLLVAEASRFGSGYNPQNADRLLNDLAIIGPHIEALEGQIRELAYRRVADIMDIFNEFGDYPRTYKVYGIFKDTMSLDGGIYYTLAIATTSSILIDPQNVEGLSDLTRDLLAVQFTPESNEIEFKRAIALHVAATEYGWALDDLVERIVKEGQREPFFLTMMDQWLSNLENEIRPGNINFTPEAAARHATAVEAVAIARGRL